MINFTNIILILCLLVCLLYIYWMHRKQPRSKHTPSIANNSETEMDELSFLQRTYDMSNISDSDETTDESILDN